MTGLEQGQGKAGQEARLSPGTARRQRRVSRPVPRRGKREVQAGSAAAEGRHPAKEPGPAAREPPETGGGEPGGSAAGPGQAAGGGRAAPLSYSLLAAPGHAEPEVAPSGPPLAPRVSGHAPSFPLLQPAGRGLGDRAGMAAGRASPLRPESGAAAEGAARAAAGEGRGTEGRAVPGLRSSAGSALLELGERRDGACTRLCVGAPLCEPGWGSAGLPTAVSRAEKSPERDGSPGSGEERTGHC